MWTKLIDKLYELRNFEDNKKYHPEANVLDHSFQCYHNAKREWWDKNLHVAALFHDLGKIMRDDTINKSPDHEKHSVDIMKECGYNNYVVFDLITNHMRMHKYLNGEMHKLKKLNLITRNPNFKLMVILARCDYMSRDVGFTIPPQMFGNSELSRLLEETNEYC